MTITELYLTHKAYVTKHHPLRGAGRLELRFAEWAKDDGLALAVLRDHLRRLGYTEEQLVAIERAGR